MRKEIEALEVTGSPSLRLLSSPRQLSQSPCLMFVFSILFYFFLLYFFAISWATPVAYGGSQARGQIGAVASSLHQSPSNSGSERLQPTPQLTATPDC